MAFTTRCGRCGKLFWREDCPHNGTERNDIDDAHAERIKARYALGKRFNPDHDTTNYADKRKYPPSCE